MWSYTQDRMISALEEAIEDPEKLKQRRKWLLLKFLYYSCCFLRNPYTCYRSEAENLLLNDCVNN